MFYVELFKVGAIGVVYIISVNLFIYKILTEYDKTLKIREYKKNGGFFSKLSRLLFSCAHLLLYISFPILILFKLMEKSNVVLKKRKETWFKQIFGQIIVVVSIVTVSIICLYYLLYTYDAYNLLSFYKFFGPIILFSSAIFFTILFFKQIMNLYKAENKSFKKLTTGYGDISKKSKYKKLADKYKHREDVFNSQYCIIYETEEEWKQAIEIQTTYGYFYKVIQVYSPLWILLINLLFSCIYYKILPLTINELYLTNTQLLNSYKMLSTYYYISGTLFTGAILIFGGLTYLLNPKIILLKRLETKSKRRIKIYQFLLILILLILFIPGTILYSGIYLAGVNYQEDNSMISEMPFDQYVENISEALENSEDYKNYSFEQQVLYLTSNPRNISTKLENLNYVESEVFNEQYDIAATSGFSSNESMKRFKEAGQTKGYTCSLTECKYSIPLSNDIFNHVVVTKDYIAIYYNQITTLPIYFPTTEYVEEKGKEELLEFKNKNSQLEEKIEVTEPSKEVMESVTIAAYGLNETRGLYENFALGFDSFKFTIDNVERRIKEMDEGYDLTLQEVSELFNNVTEEL